MTSVERLLEELKARNVVVTAEGDSLLVRAPHGNLPSGLRAELTRRKQDVLLHLLSEPDSRRLTAGPRDQPAPLSIHQKRIWVAEQVSGPGAVYNMAAGWTIDGSLDRQALEWAVTELLGRHDVLRSTITVQNGEPTSTPLPAGAFRICHEEHELADRDASLAIASREAARPFDLTSEAPFRVRLVSFSPLHHLLLITIHHIAADRSSFGIIIRELSQLYAARIGNALSPLDPPALQYADFARWQREFVTAERLQPRLEYWRHKLNGAHPELAFTDSQRSDNTSRSGDSVRFTVERELADALSSLARQQGVTLFMLTVAAYAVVLARYGRQYDLNVGCPYGNRELSETTNLVGFFVSTLVLRFDLSADPSFTEFLRTVRDTCLEAFANEVPFDMLAGVLQAKRSGSGSQLFEAMFVLQPAGLAELDLPGARVTPLPPAAPAVEFDLNMSLETAGWELKGFLEYDRSILSAAQVDSFVRSYQAVLRGTVAEPALRISELPILNAADRALITTDWNRTTPARLTHELVTAAIRHRAADCQETIALESETGRLSYRELLSRTARMAHYLIQLGAGPEVVVGLMLPRSADLFCWLLAVLESGSAFVVLNRDLPGSRIEHMIREAAPRVIVGEADPPVVLPAGVTWVRIADCAAALAVCPDVAPNVHLQARNLACVYFTSGTTGVPKGVLVEHASLASHAAAVLRDYELREGDRVLQFAATDFDVAVEELLPALVAGATVVVRPDAISESLEAFQNFVDDRRISVLNLPAPFWHVWVGWLASGRRTPPRGLRLVIAGSDRVSGGSVAEWRAIAASPVDFRNAYGATETTITAATCHLEGVRPGDSDSVPIGRPLANNRLYVLDSTGEPVPIGVIGEITVGGACVSRGYLNQPALTASFYVPDPFCETPGARMYRTGDLGRFLPDGFIEILGRTDRQLKIRGYRIEPGDIEAALEAYPGVVSTAVVARLGDSGPTLAAFVETANPAPTPGTLDQWLRDRLPWYMVPASIQIVDELPRSSAGKIDRLALGRIAAPGPQEGLAQLPRTAAERLLVGIWSDVLGRRVSNIHENFFDAGGDSIVALQILSRARDAGFSITARDIFRRQTIASLATALAARPAETPTVSPLGVFPLSPIQAWFFDHVTEDRHHFNQAVVLGVPNGLRLDVLQESLDALVAHHDSLRARFRDRQPEILPPGEHAQLKIVREEEWDAAIREANETLDIERGPLLRAVLSRSVSGHPQRLLIVIHHLAVDAVSWTILLHDLADAYRMALSGTPVQLTRKSASFHEWALRLHESIPQRLRSGEAGWWGGFLAGEEVGIAGDLAPAFDADTTAESHTIEGELDEATTDALLKTIPTASDARPEEALLAALLQACFVVSGQRSIRVDVERLGRTGLSESPDLSRTVGWFTSVVPLRLRLPGAGDAWSTLKSVREQCRRPPDDGIGFELLRWFGAPEVRQTLSQVPRASILFNYLGQVSGPADRSEFPLLDDSCGPTQSPRIRRSHGIELNAGVWKRRLRLHWSYSPVQFSAEFIGRLHAALVDGLHAICDACRTPAHGLDSDATAVLLQSLALEPEQVEDILPLTSVQEGILFHSILSGPELYLDQLRITLCGRVEPEILRSAWGRLVRRHSVLRCCVAWKGLRKGVQIVLRDVQPLWAEEDWRTVPEQEREQRMQHWLGVDRARGFEPERAPLTRITLIRTGDESFEFVWDAHHLILDGWSISVLLSEFDALCQDSSAFVTRKSGRGPTYASYIAWLHKQDEESAREFWSRELEGHSEPTMLGIDGADDDGRSLEDGFTEIVFSASETSALQAVLREHRLTPATLVQGAWAVLLSRYSQRNDVVFGVTMSGRPADLDGSSDIAGLLIRTVPARVIVPEDQPAIEWLHSLQDRQLERERFSNLPLQDIQKLSAVPGGTPLFRTLVLFQNYPVPAEFGTLSISKVEFHERTNYPVTLVAVPGPALRLQLHYDSARLNASAMDEMLAQLRTIMRGLAERPDRPAAAVALFPPAELAKILARSQGATTPAANPGPLQWLREAFRSYSQEPALIYRGDSTSYVELGRRVNRLANWLRAAGVGEEMPIGIFLPRSPDLVVAMLGVWSAGATCVPLPPGYPLERLGYMIEDCGAAVILTTTALAANLPTSGPIVTCLDADEPSIAAESETSAAVSLMPESIAYVIYTSGSTGVPKSVLSTHRGLSSLAANQAVLFGLGPMDRVLQFASAGFDAFVWELAMTLGAGAALVVPPADQLLAGEPLVNYLLQEKITAATLPPAVLAGTAVSPLPALHTLVLAGEACPLNLAGDWSVGRRFFNAYGPTESAVCATIARYEGGPVVPIGRPLDRVQTYVLNARLEPVPVGVTGDLYIGGDGLARGYAGHPALTAASFIPDPFADGQRLYKTGDRARFLPSGQLEFRGRTDNQVKVRGIRIELQEIESVLAEHPQVTSCAVVARDDVRGRHLEAFLTCVEPPSVEDLRAFLARRLPEFMLPSRLTVVPSLPLTVNGKVDRVRLAAADAQPPRHADGHARPSSSREEILCRVIADALGMDEIGVNDNFFAMGGDSILAIQVVARANQSGVHIKLQHIMDPESQTAASLAALPDAAQTAHAAGPVLERGSVPVTPIQHWFFQLNSAEPQHYNQAFLLDVSAEINTARAAAAATRLIQRHDALSLRFERTAGGWVQAYRGPVEHECFAELDLSLFDPAEAREILEERCAAEQKSLDLASGRLFRVVLFRLPSASTRILFVAHHLVVDGVSWQFLLEDFFRSMHSPEAVLQPVTSSFQEWARRLAAYADSPEARADAQYWLHAAQGVPTIPTPRAVAPGGSFTRTDGLTRSETDRLLRRVCPHFECTAEELLLAALAMAQWEVSGELSCRVDIESHGRDTRFHDLDVSRTVGWFTSMAPVSITLPEQPDLPSVVAAVRSELRRLPSRGFSFGVLRYLAGDEDIRNRLAALGTPEIGFNYLSHWDRALPSREIRPAAENAGEAFSPATPHAHLLDVNAIVEEGALRVDWTCPCESEDRLAPMAETFVGILRQAAARHDYRPTNSLVGLDEYIGREMERWGVPGLAVAAAQHGEIIRCQGFGYSDIGQQHAVSPSTLFGIGSMTKLYGTVLTAALCDDGILSWDQPIRRYLPELKNGGDPALGRLTLRDLRSNTSSIPSHDFLLRYSDMSRRDISERLPELWTPDGTLGAFQYSNLASVVACHISERMAGLDWHRAVRERVLQPLGLKETRTSPPAGDTALDYAHPHARDGVGGLREIPFLLGEAGAPAHGMYSSISDLAKHMTWMLSGDGLPHSVVSRAEWAQITTPHCRVTPIPGMDPTLDPEFGSVHGGLGLYIGTYRGCRLVFTGGRTDGFASATALLPDQGFGVTVLCNLDGSMLRLCLAWHILDLLLGVEPGGWSDRFNAREVPRAIDRPGSPAMSDSADLQEYAGRYRNPGYGEIRLMQVGEELQFCYGRLTTGLRMMETNRFVAIPSGWNPRWTLMLEFERDASGAVAALRVPLEPALGRSSFERVSAEPFQRSQQVAF